MYFLESIRETRNNVCLFFLRQWGGVDYDVGDKQFISALVSKHRLHPLSPRMES